MLTSDMCVVAFLTAQTKELHMCNNYNNWMRNTAIALVYGTVAALVVALLMGIFS